MERCSILTPYVLSFTKLTGFIVGFLNWNEVLTDIFAEQVSGVDCVLEDGNKAYTYEIVKGIPVFR
jgi:hypothetical protein